jgi:hypothetical protein
VPDLDVKLHLVHVVDAHELDENIRLKVTCVVLIKHELGHLVAEQLYILKGGVEGDIERQLLAHGR